MADNGSPAPSFETDETSTHVLVILPAYADTNNGASNAVNPLIFRDLQEIMDYGNGVINGAANGAGSIAINIINNKIHDRVSEMLKILEIKLKRAELFEKMDLSNQTRNRVKYLDPLIEMGWVVAAFPDEKTHPNQTYVNTISGERILELLNTK